MVRKIRIELITHIENYLVILKYEAVVLPKFGIFLK
jgi:hypothetical protein